MKKILIVVLMFSLAAVIGINPISAQEKIPVKEENKAVKNEAAVEQKEAQPAEEKKEESAKKSNVYTIGEIVIKEKALANVEDAATTTVLSAEDLKSRSEKTLDQALQTVPGMIVKQGSKGQMNFDMRGFRHDTVALLVDGLPFEEIYDGGGGDISRINVMNASKVISTAARHPPCTDRGARLAPSMSSLKGPERTFFEGSTEIDQYGGFSVNAAGGASYKNFYFLLLRLR